MPVPSRCLSYADGIWISPGARQVPLVLIPVALRDPVALLSPLALADGDGTLVTGDGWSGIVFRRGDGAGLIACDGEHSFAEVEAMVKQRIASCRRSGITLVDKS
jgi:hypothetical protein